MKQYLIILILQIPVFAFTQSTFIKTYFNNANGYAVAAYSDSNSYILGGMIAGASQYNPILIKTNLYGDTIWTNTLNGINVGQLTDMARSNDGGFVFLDSHSNLGINADICLTKTNESGSILWVNSIIKHNVDVGYRIKQTYDNGYIIVGRTNSLPGISGPFPYNAYIVKTNSTGDSLWTRNFGRLNENDYAFDVIETSDSNFVVAGYGTNVGIYGSQVFLIKLKPNGDVIWTKYLGMYEHEYGYGIAETFDNNYIITGAKRKNDPNYQRDAYLAKVDTAGNLLWEKSYNFSNNDAGYRVLVLNNGYLIAGNSPSDYNDVLLIKADNNGDTLWTKIISDIHQLSTLKSIERCSDNGFLISCRTNNADLTLIKTDSLGCIKPEVDSIIGEPNVSLNDTIAFHNYSVRGTWYFWFSTSGSIVSGQGTKDVEISWNQIGIDTIYSVAFNNCGSDTLSYVVMIDSCVVPKISSIIGDVHPNVGDLSNYYVNKIEGKNPVSYNWTVSLGTITAGQGSDSISVLWHSDGIDNISVIATNTCGSDTTNTYIYIVIQGVDEMTNITVADVPVYPVPANNKVYIDLPIVYQNYEIEIYDIYGKQIYHNSMPAGINEIDLSNQTSGLYFIKIIAKEKIIIKKIILNR